jgi:hypothetical protein
MSAQIQLPTPATVDAVRQADAKYTAQTQAIASSTSASNACNACPHCKQAMPLATTEAKAESKAASSAPLNKVPANEFYAQLATNTGAGKKKRRRRKKKKVNQVSHEVILDKQALMCTHMPIGFGSEDPKEQHKYFASSSITSKYYVEDAEAKRNRELQAQYKDTVSGFNSTAALQKGHIHFGKGPAHYTTAYKDQYQPFTDEQKAQPVSSRAELMGSTLKLGNETPDYTSTYTQDFVHRETSKVDPVRDTTELQQSHIKLGTHANEYSTMYRTDFAPPEDSGARAAVSSREHLMASTLVIGHEQPDYLTHYSEAYQAHNAKKSEPLGNIHELMGSHLVLGREKTKYTTATREQFQESADYLHALGDESEYETCSDEEEEEQ